MRSAACPAAQLARRAALCVASLCFHYTELAWPKVTEAAPTDVEEERRLFYVGVTRAKELLYLSRPERRTMRGRVTPRVPSRFLQGFPEGAWEAYQPSGEKVMEAEEIADMASQILERLRG